MDSRPECDSPAPMEVLVLTLASLFAGFIDSIVGGGGLILVPALFSVLPGTARPPSGHQQERLGVGHGRWRPHNSIAGSACAGAYLLPAAGTGLRGRAGRGLGGHRGAGRVPAQAAAADPGLALLVYTLARKDMGVHHAPRFSRPRRTARPPAHDRLPCSASTTAFRPRHRQLLRLPVRALAGLRLPQRGSARPSCSTP